MEQAYKLSIVLFTDEADPSDLLQAIQDAGESIASDYDGDCPEMDGANGMVQSLDVTPTSNTVTLGSTRVFQQAQMLDRVRRERGVLLSACYTALDALETDTPNEAGILTLRAAIKNAEGGA